MLLICWLIVCNANNILSFVYNIILGKEMKTMKIRKMENKELKKDVGQCCCKIVGKPSVYETDSCCLADCKKDGRDTAHYTIYH